MCTHREPVAFESRDGPAPLLLIAEPTPPYADFGPLLVGVLVVFDFVRLPGPEDMVVVVASSSSDRSRHTDSLPPRFGS